MIDLFKKLRVGWKLASFGMLLLSLFFIYRGMKKAFENQFQIPYAEAYAVPYIDSLKVSQRLLLEKVIELDSSKAERGRLVDSMLSDSLNHASIVRSLQNTIRNQQDINKLCENDKRNLESGVRVDKLTVTLTVRDRIIGKNRVLSQDSVYVKGWKWGEVNN